MGRLNIVNMYGRVKDDPRIKIDPETGEYIYGMVFLDVVRGKRAVHDDIRFPKHDYPIIMSREKEVLDQMSTWKENDVVLVKGVITTTRMEKKSFCSHCTDDKGNPTRNIVEGNFVYVTPIMTETIASYEDKNKANEDVLQHREISNQIYVLGTVLKDPKIFTTKMKNQIAQYPIAINRKFVIRTDDPTIRTDWPVVKSYGDQARKDKVFVRYQTDVIIDGFLQTRKLIRKCKCPNCGNIYEWQDNSMELIPYDVEYVNGQRTKDEILEEYGMTDEEYMQQLYESGYKDELDEEMKTDDVNEE